METAQLGAGARARKLEDSNKEYKRETSRSKCKINMHVHKCDASI